MRLSFTLAAVAATFVAATPALAATATRTATAQARGTVLQSLTLTKKYDLDFGTVAGDAVTAGTVSVDADSGARSKTGGVTLLGGTFQRAEFDGLGDANQNVTLTLNQPASGVLTNTNGTTLTATLKLDSNGTSRTTDSTGRFISYVGGDFNIAANQENGVYTATFDLTANYQ